MFKNFIKIALRNFWASKSYILMNITGLGIATAIAILAYFHFSWNNEFNSYHKNKDKIFRVHLNYTRNGNKEEAAVIPYVVGKYIKNEISSVEHVVRYSGDFYNANIKVENNVFKDGIYYADRDFFDLFSFEFLKGSPQAFKHNSSVILGEDMAKKYFGDADPMGKVISVIAEKEKRAYVVRGVIKIPPLNSSFRGHIIAPVEGFFSMYRSQFNENNWMNWQRTETFVKLRNLDDISTVNSALEKLLIEYNKNSPEEPATSFELVSMEQMVQRRVGSYTQSTMPSTFLLLTSLLAALVLLIACFNYTNTSIALAGKRLKEIGIRKVMGSRTKDLVKQFLLEHMLLTFISILVGIVILSTAGPLYWDLWGGAIYDFRHVNVLNLLLYLGLLLIFTTILSGCYPAFYISGLNPIEILKKNLKLKGGNNFTKGLLVVQFCITAIGLGTSILFIKNADFIESLNKGYAIESVISVPLRGEQELKLYENAIKSNPKILSIGGAAQNIGWGTFQEIARTSDREVSVGRLNVGANYLQTMGVALKEGRHFSEKLVSDSTKVVVNETLVKAMGIKNPILQTLDINGRKFTIIGVVRDFLQNGISSTIDPMAITLIPANQYSNLVVKSHPGDVTELNKFLEEKWKSTFPEMPYSGYPQTQDISGAVRMNSNMKTIFIVVSIISMILSLVGFYVLVSLIVNRRAKEIGVRKVLGAPILSIIKILSKSFLLILILGTLVGSILGVFLIKPVMDEILVRHVDVNIGTFLVASLAIIVIAAFTISLNVFKAAKANPVKSLRSE